MLLEATSLLAAAGELPVNVRFAIDAEEEVGGHSVVDWVEEDTGPADVAVILDGGYATETLPSICTALRGICYFHLTLRTGERDLHSGMYGGAALTATHALHAGALRRAPRAERPAARAAARRDRPPDRRRDRRLGRSAARQRGARLAGSASGRCRRRGGVLRPHHRRAVDHGQRLRERLATAPEDGAPRRGAGEPLAPARARADAGGDGARARAAPPRGRAGVGEPRRRALGDGRARLRRSGRAGGSDRAGRLRARARHPAGAHALRRDDSGRRGHRRARHSRDRDRLRPPHGPHPLAERARSRECAARRAHGDRRAPATPRCDREPVSTCTP